MDALKEADKAHGQRKFKPHFNFITLHYCYIVGVILLFSVVLYGATNITYIDALFHASGACTQSGLNTVDLITLKLYQQVILYLLPMITTPIFINTCVVNIRLHWFEKRFKHIVSMSRQPSRARTLTQGINKDNGGAAEQGVRGRNIRVLHTSDFPHLDNGHADSSSSGSTTAVGVPDGILMAHSSTGPDIHGSPSSLTQVPGGNVQFGNLPSPRFGPIEHTSGTHIAFAGDQSKGQDGKALRIPGPREFEKGEKAQEVDDEDTGALVPTRTRDREGAPGGPVRSYSFSGAATNASNFIRMRKMPTVDHILPRATTALSTAFSVGTAKTHHKSMNPFPSRPVKEIDMPYLSYTPTMGRNSQFVDLNDEQRDELGGIEYRSLKLLNKILWGYYIFFHAFGVVCVLPWIYGAEQKNYLDSLNINPAWWAIFTAETSFNDVGFTLTPDSMVSFKNCTYLLLMLTFLVIIGNTGFPCLLRFIIWAMFKLVPKNSSIHEALHFLIDHPRRCFTLLFPGRETWVLFWVLVGLNLADLILFISLDLKNPEVVSIPVGNRIVVGLFQAAATRTAGLTAVSIAALHPAVQVSYMVMMYISVFPIAISVRRTNVYEEKSLGLYTGDDEVDDGTGASYVGIHFRKQLSFDLWYVFLGLFIICISEGKDLSNTNEYAFTIFSVLFEVVSAYGTVGLSMGYPGTNPSFSSKFNVVSKLVIVAMQIRGRHRGLPYELDRAILLPKEQRDEELAAPSIRRRNSGFSQTHSFSHSFGRGPVPSQAIDDNM